uniref:Fibroblast growth factor n=2 Tax=Nyssomyia neivai TaxID=330878 RepID=A0A1L8DJH2_9DIPT
MRRSEWMCQRRTLDWFLVVLLVFYAARISLGAALPDASDEVIAQHTLDYTIFTVRDRIPKFWRFRVQNTSVQDAQQNLHRHQARQVFVFGDTDTGTILSRTYRSVAERRRRRRGDTKLERNQRSANLSFAMGSARKIQLFIKNRYLQLLPDGTVNGTQNVHSDFTILQRTTVDVGKIKIQGVATCLYLCMDMCGGIYASRKFTDDCVFNETMEEHHYNAYSSTYNSNAQRVLYLAINRNGQPRRLWIPSTRTLGNLTKHTNSLTHFVEPKRVEDLVARIFGQNHVRHGLKQLCDSGINVPDVPMVARPKCNMGIRKKSPKKCTKGHDCAKRKKCEGKKCKQRPNKVKNKKRPKEVEHQTTTEADDLDDRTFVFDDDA